MEIVKLKIHQLKKNTGQIYGLPKNPRVIKDVRYKLLVQSIEEDPEMIELRELIVYPLNDYYVIIAGNMRYTALCELGYKEVPCKILEFDTPIAKLKAITIKDNTTYGNFNYDDLANEWDNDLLTEWGCEVWDSREEEKEIDLPNAEQKEPQTFDGFLVTFQVKHETMPKIELLLNKIKEYEIEINIS